MKVKRSLSLHDAAAIVDTALKCGREKNFDPLVVVVLDSGGVPVAFKSEDGTGVMRFDVAMGKAYGALGMGTSSRTLQDRMEERQNFSSALSTVSDGRFVPVPGGVLIVDDDGFAIGAVGISGDVSVKDEYCAIVAIKKTGFSTEPAEIDPNWETA